MLGLLYLIIACNFGFILTLPVLLPTLRRASRRNPRARMILLVLFSLLAFAISFSVYTYGASWIEYEAAVVRDNSGGLPPAEWHINEGAIIAELWTRFTIPPLLHPPCYSSQEFVCHTVDDIVAYSGDYWRQSVLFSLLASLAACGWVWLFTIPESGQAQR